MEYLGQDEDVDMILAIGNGGDVFYRSIRAGMKEVYKSPAVAVLIPLEIVLEASGQLIYHCTPGDRI